jgi:hypothetical protein
VLPLWAAWISAAACWAAVRRPGRPGSWASCCGHRGLVRPLAGGQEPVGAGGVVGGAVAAQQQGEVGAALAGGQGVGRAPVGTGRAGLGAVGEQQAGQFGGATGPDGGIDRRSRRAGVVGVAVRVGPGLQQQPYALGVVGADRGGERHPGELGDIGGMAQEQPQALVIARHRRTPPDTGRGRRARRRAPAAACVMSGLAAPATAQRSGVQPPWPPCPPVLPLGSAPASSSSRATASRPSARAGSSRCHREALAACSGVQPDRASAGWPGRDPGRSRYARGRRRPGSPRWRSCSRRSRGWPPASGPPGPSSRGCWPRRTLPPAGPGRGAGLDLDADAGREGGQPGQQLGRPEPGGHDQRRGGDRSAGGEPLQLLAAVTCGPPPAERLMPHERQADDHDRGDDRTYQPARRICEPPGAAGRHAADRVQAYVVTGDRGRRPGHDDGQHEPDQHGVGPQHRPPPARRQPAIRE